jgi:hypothetical protein
MKIKKEFITFFVPAENRTVRIDCIIETDQPSCSVSSILFNILKIAKKHNFSEQAIKGMFEDENNKLINIKVFKENV